jgi:hypothetical protein
MNTQQKIVAGVVGAVVAATGAFATLTKGGASATPGTFAQVNKNGVVQREIIISQAEINTGLWGDPTTFVAVADPSSTSSAPLGSTVSTSTGAVTANPLVNPNLQFLPNTSSSTNLSL